jgi:hypothetical protein
LQIIVDFTPFKGKNLLVRTPNVFADQAYQGMDKAMQFRVGHGVSSNEGNGDLPAAFNVNIKFPEDRIAVTRNFKLMSHMDMMWGIGKYHMDDPMQRVMMKPPLGTVEKIVFQSGGVSMGGMSGMHGGSSSGSGEQGTPGSKSSGGSGAMPGMSGSSETSVSTGISSSTHQSHHGGGSMGGASASSSMGMESMSGPASTGGHGSSVSMDMQSNKNPASESMPGHEGGASNIPSHGPDMSIMNHGSSSTIDMSSHHPPSKRQTDMNMESMMSSMSNPKKPDYWSHSMHLHLVDLRIVGRYKAVANRTEGRDAMEDYERDAIKDIAFFGKKPTVLIMP